MDDIREVLDVTGHSLGGALAEMVGKVFGLKGANIDGPGVSVLVGESQYRAFQDKVAADPDLSGFQRDYIRPENDFVSNGFSFVSIAGTHLNDTNFDALSNASNTYYNGLNVLSASALTLNPLMIGAGLVGTITSLAIDGTNHPLGAILQKNRVGAKFTYRWFIASDRFSGFG